VSKKRSSLNHKSANNHMHSDSKKRRSFLALLFAAGDVRRCTHKEGPLADNSKWFQIYVAAVGVLVTGILGYGQCRLGQQQNEILNNQAAAAKANAIDTIEVQVMTLVSPHLGLLGSDSDAAKRSEGVVLAAAEYLSDQYGRTSLAEMAAEISEASATVSTPTRTRLEEAREAPPDSPTYFTVLASLPADNLDAARAVANSKLAAARGFGVDAPIQIYKTK